MTTRTATCCDPNSRRCCNVCMPERLAEPYLACPCGRGPADCAAKAGRDRGRNRWLYDIVCATCADERALDADADNL